MFYVGAYVRYTTTLRRVLVDSCASHSIPAGVAYCPDCGTEVTQRYKRVPTLDCNPIDHTRNRLCVAFTNKIGVTHEDGSWLVEVVIIPSSDSAAGRWIPMPRMPSGGAIGAAPSHDQIEAFHSEFDIDWITEPYSVDIGAVVKAR